MTVPAPEQLSTEDPFRHPFYYALAALTWISVVGLGATALAQILGLLPG